jgi:SAM-dependent methyltransferase
VNQAPKITPELIADLPKNGPTDPIEFYRRPVVGWLYRERINRGFGLLPQRRFARALEVGYGAGAVQLALSHSVDELHGIDLDADPAPVRALLNSRGASADLRQGSVLELPYPDGHFDLAVCFSVFEHLKGYKAALRETARVLKPGGLFLLGMPSVNKLMEAGFLAIGFKGINDHHVTTPQEASASFEECGFALRSARYLDFPMDAPLGMRLYYNWLLEKPHAH